MRVAFIEAKYGKKVLLPKKVLDKLPGKIMLFMTAQLIDQREEIVKQLESAGKKIILKKPRHAVYEGQLLGCATVEFKGSFDAFLYVGDGMFHPEALMMKNDKPIHVYNHVQDKYLLLTAKDAALFRKKREAAKLGFLMSKNIGVLVTTKPGQNKLSSFSAVEKKYPDKNFYYLVNNNIEPERLEDFQFIECFVNTACERIAYDDYDKFGKPVVNMEDVP